MKKARIAVTGMGNMGRGHSSNLLKMENAELVALCDENPEAAEKFLEEKNATARVYSDFYEMIEKEELDGVYICLPPFCHNGQVEAAAKAGVGVFIEKPIALDMERGKSMADAIAENNVVSQVGYQMRFGDAVVRFKEILDSKEAGKPTLFTASYECNSLHGPWWRKKDMCGGQLFEQVIHLYDMAQYLMGDAVDCSGRIANILHTEVPDYTIEDTSVANMVFESGALGCITGSNCAVREQWNAKFRVVCEHLVADFTDQNNGTITYTDEGVKKTEKITGNTDVTLKEDEYFVGALLGEHEPFATIPEGYSDLALVSTVVKSSENNGTVMKVQK